MSFKKCPGCKKEISDTVYWQCTKCKQTFKIDFSKLKKIQEQKNLYPDKTLLKCTSCGYGMDDGNERIVFKCRDCGAVISGNLKYFFSDKKILNNIFAPILVSVVIVLALIGYVFSTKSKSVSLKDNFDINYYTIEENTDDVPSAIKIVDASYKIDDNNHLWAYIVNNCSTGTINTITLDINLLDRDENIVATIHLQETSRLKPGKNITIDSWYKPEENVYSAVVEGYSYNLGENKDKYVYKYADEEEKEKSIIYLKKDESKEIYNDSSLYKPKTYTHTCEQCSKEGIHSIIGLSGETEYYCDKHYNALEDMLEKMFGEQW